MEGFIGELRMFGGPAAPTGWALCDGRLLDIATNDALYQLIGTAYGGDGVSTFAVPDLRGQIPVHRARGQALGTSVDVTFASLGWDDPWGDRMPGAPLLFVSYIICLQGVSPA